MSASSRYSMLSIIESPEKEIQISAYPGHSCLAAKIEADVLNFEKKLDWHYWRRRCLLTTTVFRLAEIVFGGIDASFPLRERTQVHLCHPKEEFIRNEEGSKGKENIHLPAASKCCLSPDKESSLNVTSVSAQAFVMVFNWLKLFVCVC